LLDAVQAARSAGVAERDVAAASVFTTMSVTATLEKMRDQIHAATPAPADFLLGPGGTRTVFHLTAMAGITFNQQTRTTGPVNPPGAGPAEFRNAVPGPRGAVALGRYVCRDYLVRPGEYIPPVGTRTGVPAIQQMNEVYFNLFLPAGPAPAGGWPVVVFGHSTSTNKNEEPLRVAATM